MSLFPFCKIRANGANSLARLLFRLNFHQMRNTPQRGDRGLWPEMTETALKKALGCVQRESLHLRVQKRHIKSQKKKCQCVNLFIWVFS